MIKKIKINNKNLYKNFDKKSQEPWENSSKNFDKKSQEHWEYLSKIFDKKSQELWQKYIEKLW